MNRPKRKLKLTDKVCPYSDSCFTCPMKDCVIGVRFHVNEILSADDKFELIEKYAYKDKQKE